MFRPLALLLFFPSITFGLISAEVFPWGIIFAAVYMRYCAQPMLALLGLLCVSSCFALLMSFVSDGTSETDVIRSLAAYVNVILVSQTLLLLGKSVV